MTNAELTRLLESVATYQVTAHEAIRRLVTAGHDKGLAAELVLIALGGSDIIDIGADGVARYNSGRTVTEVTADIKAPAAATPTAECRGLQCLATPERTPEANTRRTEPAPQPASVNLPPRPAPFVLFVAFCRDPLRFPT